MDLGLQDRVVVVTGGTDGLGLGLAHGLVAEGGRVAVCGRDAARLGSAVSGLEAAGGDVLGVRADVTRPDDLTGLVDAVVGRWGRIDGLVNNAGRSAARPVVDIGDDEWTADLELKLLAAARLVRLAAPHLRAQGGSVVNVLSIAARAAGGGSAPSSVSRAAGLALTKVLSHELAPDGIRVNAVLVGIVESGQWERQEPAGTTRDERYRRMAEQAGIPLGRVGRAAEFADLAAYLLSARASYVTGTAVNLDGGLSAVA